MEAMEENGTKNKIESVYHMHRRNGSKITEMENSTSTKNAYTVDSSRIGER